METEGGGGRGGSEKYIFEGRDRGYWIKPAEFNKEHHVHNQPHGRATAPHIISAKNVLQCESPLVFLGGVVVSEEVKLLVGACFSARINR